ncbi:hypothetical protein Dda_2399 [Drechslerella dactyloides]|uniref:F-box domain-containing protein n=1 Tax=Drechslerella dactyloides TaxID=74499 RepID=A0AAD6NMP0_DREDA|nr:hypothetical protein Dda_2399 [Drechslerella dactyloides]
MAMHKPKPSIGRMPRDNHQGVVTSKLSTFPRGGPTNRFRGRHESTKMEPSDIIHLFITICATVIFLTDCFYFNETTKAWPAPVKPPFSIVVYIAYSFVCRYTIFYVSRKLKFEWHEERPLASRGLLEHLGLAVYQRQGRRLRHITLCRSILWNATQLASCWITIVVQWWRAETVDMDSKNTPSIWPNLYRLSGSNPFWLIDLKITSFTDGNQKNNRWMVPKLIKSRALPYSISRLQLPTSSPIAFVSHQATVPSASTSPDSHTGIMEQSGPFLFEFPVPRPSRKNTFVSPKEAAEEPSASLASALASLRLSDKDAVPPPILLLPAEVHHIIASYCSLPSEVISLSRTCHRLYASVGPSNRLLWYNLRYNKTKRIEQNNVPEFSRDDNHYQECLAIMCNRKQKAGCQRCLAYDYRMYNTSKWDKNDDRTSDLVDLYVAKIFHGTWCWKCTREMFDSVALVQQVTPLPEIPSVLLTEIREHSCGHKKPGYFVSRSAIAKAIKEQCPNGSYTNFYVHRYPQLESDMREAKPYILQTVVDIYTKQYKHLHLLFPPSQLGQDLNACLQIKQPPIRKRPLSQDAFLDSVFEIASRYLATKTLAEQTREQERLDACKHFLNIFFGQPSDGDDDYKMWTPTTIFLARMAKDYWLARMKDCGQPVPEARQTWLRPGVEDSPKRKCRFCTIPEAEKEDGSKVQPHKYSPILMTFHMIYQHPEMLKEDWHQPRTRKLTDLENIKEADAAAEKDEETENADKTAGAESGETVEAEKVSEPIKPVLSDNSAEVVQQKETLKEGTKEIVAIEPKDTEPVKEVTAALVNLRLEDGQAQA